MEKILSNKIAIVTASTKGIGLASAIKLAKHGAKVYMAARNEESIKQQIIENPDLNLNFVYFDATNKESIKSMIKTVFEKEKKIDILVNNYGGSNPILDKTILDTNYEDYLNTIDLNLSSVFIASQELCKYMTNKQLPATIVNISTIGSVVPDISRIGYTSSKAAINSLTQNIATQMGIYNIRCNAILPGLIHTDAVKQNLNEKFIKTFKSFTPLQQDGMADDIANAVLYFASDMSKYVTGQLLEVSGGFGKASPLISLINIKN